jgi:septum formation protein
MSQVQTHPPASREIVLASSSPYRRQLLRRFGLPFTCATPVVDENPLPGESPEALVRRLAQAKARDVSVAHRDAVIIGSDQVAVLQDGRLLTKPGNHATAQDQLRLSRGREVRFLTGVCVLDAATGVAQIDVVNCAVRFRQITDAEIERYLLADRPYDCAGAFRSEALGVSLLEDMSLSDPTALVGLPLIRLAAMLRETGVAVP